MSVLQGAQIGWMQAPIASHVVGLSPSKRMRSAERRSQGNELSGRFETVLSFKKASQGSTSRRQSRRMGFEIRSLFSSYEFPPSAASPVKVYEQGKQNSKRIVAETIVHAPVEQVWKVLTDYETLPTFVPNLEQCERVTSGRNGKVRIKQRGCSQGAFWRLEAEAVLEVEEFTSLPMGRREARFNMISGDFKEFNGRWVIEPSPESANTGSSTILRYDISVVPHFNVPSAMVSYVVRAGLPANIKAVAERAETLYNQSLQASGLASWAGIEEDPPIPMPSEGNGSSGESDGSQNGKAGKVVIMETLPTKGPFWPAGSAYAAAAPLTAVSQRQRAQAASARSMYLGVTSIPLPPSGDAETALQQQYLDQQQQYKEQIQASYPAFTLRRNGSQSVAPKNNNVSSSSSSSSSDEAPPNLVDQPPNSRDAALAATASLAEVHLRRLDQLDFLHRRAVSAITINAPIEAVWQVLTDYDHLAEFVPNLAISERIALPTNAPRDVVRLRQVGYKNMFYMRLHAESVLDLIEKRNSEIQFRQVAGDFERFQGKWMLSQAPLDNDNGDIASGPQTQLKYAVEIVIPKTTRMLGIMEPVLERVVFEDMPANLAAIKRHVEARENEREAATLENLGESRRAASLRRKNSRPKLADMVDEFNVLAAELQRVFGDEHALPTRNVLREMNRSDIEKAIAAHGGPSAVAERLGWQLKVKSRKPKGYWDSLENVQQEIDEFIKDQRMRPGVMPIKNDFVRAGRFDIARAVERWGGLYELAEELGYDVASPNFSSTEWQEHISEVAATTGLSGKQGLFQLAAQTYKKGEEEPNSNGAKSKKLKQKSSATKLPSMRDEIDAW